MSPHLQIHDGRTTVAQHQPVSIGFDAVLVSVDKSRRHHQPRGVDGLLAGDLFLGDDGDPAVSYADVGCVVEHGFRVHDPAAADHQIVVGGQGRRYQHQADNDASQLHRELLHLMLLCL